VDVTLYFGIHRYIWLMELGRNESCAWHLLRRELDGTRFLAQVWSPRPSERNLDHIRDTFLSRFLDASPLDPVPSHLGFDGIQAWFLQAIQGNPMARIWAGWGESQRKAALEHLDQQLERDPHPRFLHPEVITFRPGLTQIPRVIGKAPWGPDMVTGFLPKTAPVPALTEDLPWTHPRGFSEPISRPLRGRGQELPYLKSLVLGFGAPVPMERIVLLQGEEGIGKEHLATWACAVAEGEGIWVHHLAASADETPGRFLGRLIESLLMGCEADFYAERPGAAKTLSHRLQAFAFLMGGHHVLNQEAGLEPEEVHAALEAMDFAGLLQPRLLHLSGLDRATPGVLILVRELAHASTLPWLLSLTTGAQGTGLKPLVSRLHAESAAAVVGLNRLDDGDLRLVLDDLLGRHDLPDTFCADLITQSLGNPGLLRNFLELADQSGTIVWDGSQWHLAPGQSGTLVAKEDLVRQILLGRLQRLTAASATLLRLLALAERPLPLAVLGRLLGLPDEALDDALLDGVGSSLVQTLRGEAAIPDHRWRGLVLAKTPPPELKRLARALSAVFRELNWDCPVPLQSLAFDEARALATVLTSLDQEPTGSAKNIRLMVDQALQLKPSPSDEARLHEHLADAWMSGSQALEESGPPPAEEALVSLDHALEALSRVPPNEEVRLREARLHRKCAMLRLQLRQPVEANKYLQAASERLHDHPLHPEHPRLKLALGQLHLLQGHRLKGMRALEEGLLPQSGLKLPAQDHAALLLALGKTLGGESQFLRATSMLQSAQRMLELVQDARGLVPVQIALAQVRLAQGQSEACILLLREALQTARRQADPVLQAQAHLAFGMLRSVQQFLGPALSHLDRALSRAKRLGNPALVSLIQIWRARTFAALGEMVAADHAQFEALAAKPACLSPEEQGDLLFLQAEVARFRSAWRDAARLFKAAADCYETHGLVWRQRVAQLRSSQAVAREARGSSRVAPEQDWTILEDLKGPVDGSGSRWLDLEWHRTHALLLSTVPASDAVIQEALDAWGEVQTAARDLQFHAQVLEASAEGAQLLLRRGENLGARARMQDAFPSFQQLWTRLPEPQGSGFLGREDMHHFRQMVEAVGLRFIQPEPVDPIVDWAPTQVNLPALPNPE
jgi:tetratricopeptide (TPR) repeat protein